MKKSLASHIICKSCRVPLEPVVFAELFDNIEYGMLVCKKCEIAMPVLSGFVHADYSLLAEQLPTLEYLKNLEQKLLPRISNYEEALRSQSHRTYDSYAAFQPFNESTRALYPLLGHIRKHLHPGDLILDTWCRTGFSGALLAGFFPEQHIVSIWEGNLGVLGFSGYKYWLNSSVRPTNWDIMFTHPGQGLPFTDGTFGMIHALDSLHRYSFSPFLSDCIRTASPLAAIIFPHVHLANSDPDPFFERGGVQLHGEEYREYFDKLFSNGSRKAIVLSEQDLFNLDRAKPLIDQAQTPHYNGLIAILNDDFAELPLTPYVPHFSLRDRPLRQPLVGIDEATGVVQIDIDRASDLLDRHPCYVKRLEKSLPKELTRAQARIWSWIEAGASWGDISQKLGKTKEELQVEAEELERAEMLMTLPIGAAMSRLQAFYINRTFTPPLAEQCFTSIWNELSARYPSRDVMRAEDGSVFRSEDIQVIVNAMAALFFARGVKRGARVAIMAGPHAESILAVWACWLCGAVVSPIDPAMPLQQRDELIKQLTPSLILFDGVVNAEHVAPVLFCNSSISASDDKHQELGVLLSDYFDVTSVCIEVKEADAAVILFTSGSTGQPKGVVLSHGALYRGADTLAQAYDLNQHDTISCPGGLHTMSGLRNNCVTPLLAGATIAALDARQFGHPVAAAAACRRHNISVLSVVPAFVHAVRAVDKPLAFGSLRQILCTGTMLSLRAQREVEQLLKVPIHMYYGLTETGGVCTILKPGTTRLSDGDIGVPARACLRLVDESGNQLSDAGVIGEIEVYNTNLMLGYLDNQAATQARMRDGWLRTGDLARIEGGHFVLCGRADDQYKTRQGIALHPGVIEELLCTHDDVAEAAVVGVNLAGGPRLYAWLITRHPVAEGWNKVLFEWLASRLNSQYMPDNIEVVTSLPRAANGKISREVLREKLRSMQ